METLALLIALPLLLALLSITLVDIRMLRRLEALLLVVHLGTIIFITSPVIYGALHMIHIADGLEIKRLGAMFLILANLVVACSMIHAHFFFSQEEKTANPPTAQRIKFFYFCVNAFLIAMSMVFVCNNLGYLWIAIEATTLSSAPLVYFTRTKHALEATWKYLMICSVGIAFALLGTVFIFASSQHGHASGGSLDIAELVRDAQQLQYPLLKLGFIFCFLGYGTKAGMFPLHSWLPDAHSEAPAPASAMLSGSLLNCALFGIWRVSEILLAAQHAAITHNLIIWAGTITVVAASLFLVRQHGFKRLWAYSSIENVGLMLVAIGIGSGALFFLQALNHSIAKVSLFLLSGNVVQATGSKELHDLRGIIKVSPVWALLLALSAFAVTGAPPFGAFISEWLILTQSIDGKDWLPATLLVLALALSFVAVCAHLGKVLFGKPKRGVIAFRQTGTSFVPALLIFVSLILGFSTSSNLLGLAP